MAWDAILTCIIKESVPSSAKLGLEDVLFLLIRLNTLSSPALECGITRTSLATVESSGNLDSLLPGKTCHSGGPKQHPF